MRADSRCRHVSLPLDRAQVRSAYLSGAARVLASFDEDNQLRTCTITGCILGAPGFDVWEEIFPHVYPEYEMYKAWYHGSRAVRLTLRKGEAPGGGGCFVVAFQVEQRLRTGENATHLSFSAVEDISRPSVLRDYINSPRPHYMNVSLELAYGWPTRNGSVALAVSEGVCMMKTDPVAHANLHKTARLSIAEDLGVEDPWLVRGVRLCMDRPRDRDAVIMIDEVALTDGD
jgi:hypothetical protein